MHIYIASKYTAATDAEMQSNANIQIDTAIDLMLLGHTPLAPLLMHYLDKRAKENNVYIEYDEYMKWCLNWIDKCDALLYLSKSKGSDIELEYAKSKGLKIYFSLDQIIKESVIND